MEPSWHSQTYPSLRSKPKMPSFDTYNAKTTSISYPWPATVNGVERIALSAQGDLQRVLSSFFARPIVIALVYSHTMRQASLQSALEPVAQPTPAIIASASPTSPIIQTRQVHLQCAGKIVCTATSTVRITSPECAHLFLQEKYAIGQMFRRLEKVPAFELLSVGLGAVTDDQEKEKGGLKMSTSTSMPTSISMSSLNGNPPASLANQLWRKYTLIIPNFECEILEVFPDRNMFLGGEKWLTGEENEEKQAVTELLSSMKTGDVASTVNRGLQATVVVGFLLMLAFELSMYAGGRWSNC